ncbi:hypothetical protein V8C86DRAFT_2460821 [Haematococcus lacustris]
MDHPPALWPQPAPPGPRPASHPGWPASQPAGSPGAAACQGWAGAEGSPRPSPGSAGGPPPQAVQEGSEGAGSQGGRQGARGWPGSGVLVHRSRQLHLLGSQLTPQAQPPAVLQGQLPLTAPLAPLLHQRLVQCGRRGGGWVQRHGLRLGAAGAHGPACCYGDDGCWWAVGEGRAGIGSGPGQQRLACPAGLTRNPRSRRR